ncbi:unnamed protein product [Amoebophrya sp. A120]|nr:unnamed protein product [Amoebophrya sp. A120]|eukprot:GSA120T00018723001.1
MLRDFWRTLWPRFTSSFSPRNLFQPQQTSSAAKVPTASKTSTPVTSTSAMTTTSPEGCNHASVLSAGAAKSYNDRTSYYPSRPSGTPTGAAAGGIRHQLPTARVQYFDFAAYADTGSQAWKQTFLQRTAKLQAATGGEGSSSTTTSTSSGTSAKKTAAPNEKKRVALLVDGDHAMPAQLDGIIQHFNSIGATVPVRRAYFGRADIAEGRKWGEFGHRHRFELIVVKKFGTSNAELVDKKLSIDAIRFGLVDRYNVAIMSRDKGFAEVFAELSRNDAPEYYAVSQCDNTPTRSLFEKYGATFVADRPPDYVAGMTSASSSGRVVRRGAAGVGFGSRGGWYDSNPSSPSSTASSTRARNSVSSSTSSTSYRRSPTERATLAGNAQLRGGLRPSHTALRAVRKPPDDRRQSGTSSLHSYIQERIDDALDRRLGKRRNNGHEAEKRSRPDQRVYRNSYPSRPRPDSNYRSHPAAPERRTRDQPLVVVQSPGAENSLRFLMRRYALDAGWIAGTRDEPPIVAARQVDLLGEDSVMPTTSCRSNDVLATEKLPPAEDEFLAKEVCQGEPSSSCVKMALRQRKRSSGRSFLGAHTVSRHAANTKLHLTRWLRPALRKSALRTRLPRREYVARRNVWAVKYRYQPEPPEPRMRTTIVGQKRDNAPLLDLLAGEPMRKTQV